jgi:hypothetical protein
MPKTIIAQTNEVDEADIAMIDILAQLDLDNNLKSNSVGFLFGDVSQFDPELLPALANRMPFDIIGVNSPISTGPNHKDEYNLLTLMVFTSDDVSIACGLSDDFGTNGPDSIKDLYVRLAAKLDNTPKLILLFGSRQSTKFHPDRVIDRLDSVAKCPIFGCLGCDLDVIMEKGYLIHNGQMYMDRMAMVLIDGPIKPRFSLYMIPENKWLKRKAIITCCEGNVIKEINGLPAIDYLTTLGLKVGSKSEFAYNVPLIMENHSAGYSEPVLMLQQEGDDSVICTQDVEENSTLGLAGLDDTDVIKSAGDLADELKWEHFDFCLIHSCQGRHISLGLDYLSEIDRIRTSLSNIIPYTFSYSGGEICPRIEGQKGSTNSFHSLSLACCRF